MYIVGQKINKAHVIFVGTFFGIYMHLCWQKEIKNQKNVKSYFTTFLQLTKGLVYEKIKWNTRSSYTFTFHLIYYIFTLRIVRQSSF